MTTELLDRAIRALSQLPEKEQDRFAFLIIEELRIETAFNRIFFHTSDETIDHLVQRIRSEVKKGKRVSRDSFLRTISA